ncbi:MAG: hypothetical protein EAZ60_25555 [Oscillatoriales cyanobacterium]|nr:MAG: hypothetical protein EAZ83_14740 [Oscillatoriales cyanobacterium]TAE95544.1 MAG: hypothetical protein EAZ79_18715 [Oscillatoriales cyanobacterium]TAF19090.1 MAG: hypothetical protein EAZ73_16535 [Oscillatoriales cyanobacterium]TAF31659.1 MAG: hypothetical protein EAZ69_19075 [Oscillatoriales cyanobacterium]TAF51705.1 MAG: hypothetical protein EAZ60_25555 [Oscillatoriales cyanobacterium]
MQTNKLNKTENLKPLSSLRFKQKNRRKFSFFAELLHKVKFCVKNGDFHLSGVDKSSKKSSESERKLRVPKNSQSIFHVAI